MITDERLAELKKLCAEATQPGPWTLRKERGGRCVVLDVHGFWVCDVVEFRKLEGWGGR